MELFDRAAVGFQLVLTKVDDVKPEKLGRKLEEVQAAVKAHAAAYPEVIATSSRTGVGIEALRGSLATLAGA
jgi:GTP-binding protein